MAIDTDYGNDIDCVNDLTFAMGEVSGSKMMAQAMARRFVTPRGGLFYNGEYGYDLRQFMSDGVPSLSAINGAVENEALKDKRVEDVEVESEYDESTQTLEVGIVGFGAAGPFALTLSVSEVTVELLREGNA